MRTVPLIIVCVAVLCDSFTTKVYHVKLTTREHGNTDDVKSTTREHGNTDDDVKSTMSEHGNTDDVKSTMSEHSNTDYDVKSTMSEHDNIDDVVKSTLSEHDNTDDDVKSTMSEHDNIDDVVKSTLSEQSNTDTASEFFTFDQTVTSDEVLTSNYQKTGREVFTPAAIMKDTATTSQRYPATTSELISDESKLLTEDTETLPVNDERLLDGPDVSISSRQNILSALASQTDKQRAFMPNYEKRFKKGKLSRKFQTRVWSGTKFSNKKTQQESDGGEEESESDVTEEDYDYDYEDNDSLYTLAHFRQELYAYVDDRLSMMNSSLLEQLINMQEKITNLENQLRENIALTCALESALKVASNPQRGDIRFLKNGKCGTVTRAGYLQFYTGTDWGFVCDDFFDLAAAKVACKQIGFTETLDSVTSTNMLSRIAQNLSSYDASLTTNFQIVLDDVQCRGNENNLDSCSHFDLGKHDCIIEEAVFLTC